jgi:thymidylate synthase
MACDGLPQPGSVTCVTVVVVDAPTLGEGWLRTSRAILERGALERYDGQPTRELALLTLTVAEPASDDPLIAELGDAEWLAWMHENFFVEKDVPELGDAKSYAVRLFNYAGAGRDQIAWVIERLRDDPECRSAAVTTFQPLTDTAYIPCVSLLDFWIRADAVELVVYAHSLDFGKKAYGNLVELARLQEHVASELARPVGQLVVHAKSAHVYEPEWAHMAELVQLLVPGTA